MENARRKCPKTHKTRTLQKKGELPTKYIYISTKTGEEHQEAITENNGRRGMERNRPTKSYKSFWG